MSKLDFSFSDTIAGYVTQFNRAEKSFGLRTSDGREFKAFMTPNTFARFSFNLDEGYADATGMLAELLSKDQFVFAYGVFYPQQGEHKFEVKSMIFPGSGPTNSATRSRIGGSSKCARSPTATCNGSSTTPTSQLTTATTAPSCTWAAAKKATSSRRPTPFPAWFTALPRPT